MRRCGLMLIALMMVASAFGIGSVPAFATGRIVLERWAYEEEETEGDLYLLEQGASSFQPIPIWGLYPAIDPSGKLITYYSSSPSQGIYVTDVHGNRRQKVVSLSEGSGPSQQEWAPDGQSILADINENIELFTPGAEVWTGKPLITWPGKQMAATLSGDGKKLAFLSNTNSAGEYFSGLNTYAIFVANADGSEAKQINAPEILTDPVTLEEFVLDRQALSLSPDGTELAFAGYVAGPEEEWEDAELATIDLATGQITQLTHTKGQVSYPDWLPDGDIAYIHHSTLEGYWKETQLMKISSEGGEPVQLGPETEEGGQKWIANLSGLQPTELPELTSESISRAETLLYKYAPTLRYDSLEPYRAIGVSSITNLYSGEELEESNRLVNEAGETIAYANPALSTPALSLSLLQGAGENYPETKTEVSEGDRLVERENYEADAAAFQANPSIADRIYGHPVYEGGRWWLEYWLWYYYDEFNLFGFGDHEGDWELVVVELSKTGEPVDAIYAQHHDSEADRCNFVNLNWSVGPYGNVSPNVYVARGTHASYVRPGLLLGSPPLDEADGEGYVARPVVLPMSAKGWAAWPGRWGNSLGEGQSPMAPISQTSRWAEPQEFLEQAEGCPTEEEGAVLSRVGGRNPRARHLMHPLPPVLSNARIEKAQVRVHYRIRRRANERRPLGIYVSVLSSRSSVTPTHKAVWRATHGTIAIPIPDGPGPYTVVGLTGTARGVNSRRVSVQVGHSRAGRPPTSDRPPVGGSSWIRRYIEAMGGPEPRVRRKALVHVLRQRSKARGSALVQVRPADRR